MISPDHFDVVYQINNHMSGKIPVNKNLATLQWNSIKDTYQKLGFNVQVINGTAEFPDMVFSANQLFSTPEHIFYSHMRYPQRQGEVEMIKNSLKSKSGIQVQNYFEGMGDFIWDYEGERIFCGYGYRTRVEAIDEVSVHCNYEMIPIQLINENFYHLDTCLSIINKNTALYVESAFSEETIKTLKKSFKKLIKVDEEEAINYLACNCHCPDGKNILVEKNAVKTKQLCMDLGLEVFPIDTSEYLKSGGSIFCLKNQIVFYPW